MEKSCRTSGCPLQATHECTCQEKYKFCEQHIRIHSALGKCYYKSFDESTLLLIIKMKQNALNNLSSETTQLANIMINEINSSLKDSLAYINKEKKKIYDFILNKQNDKVDDILARAENLKLLSRKRVDFIKSTKSLLCVDKKFSNETNYIEELEKKIEGLEKDKKEANDKIQEQEISLNEYKEMHKNGQKLIQEEKNLSVKKYDEALQKNNNIEKELAEIRNLVQEKEKESEDKKLLRIKRLENEVKALKASSEQFNSKSRQLDNGSC